VFDRGTQYGSAAGVSATDALTLAIPCWNAGPYLRPMLDSVLSQTQQEIRLLLVDDGSTDGSLEVAREFGGSRLQVVENEISLGIGGNWNRCAELVETEFFCLAHQDDIYEPGYVETMLGKLRQNSNAGIAHCRAIAIDSDGKQVASAAERYKQHFWKTSGALDRASYYRRIWRGNFIACPAVVYRTEAWRKAGPFRTDLRFALDWEYWFRVLRAGFTIVDVEEPLMRYRRHATAATRAATDERWRFEEELQVLQDARKLGVGAGLMTHEDSVSPALRNNLLHEALCDLEARRFSAVARKLAFVRSHASDLWSDPYVRVFRVLSRMGVPGRKALSMARGIAIRYGLGGAAE
jgi:glycosyltransferase involved in cell wall biosynthesis